MSAIVNNLVNEHRRLFPNEVQELLMEGNKRFVSGEMRKRDLCYKTRLELSENGQHPSSVVITCSDSRVVPEFIFDQGLGDVFVVRNAGNVIGINELGSIEYAVKHLKVPLILVLGHEKCGVIEASINKEEDGTNIGMIIRQVSPSIQKVRDRYEDYSSEELISKVEDENIKLSAKKLLKSPIIKEYVEKGEVKIVPAKYYIETGKVKLLEPFKV